MSSRPFKITLAIASVLGLLAVIVATNSSLSRRPISIDLGMASSPQSLPIAWRGNDIWLLASLSGSTSGQVLPSSLRAARSWNRTRLSIIRTAYHDGDLVTLNPANADFARSDGGGNDARIQIWRGSTLRRLFKEIPYRNRYGVVEAGRPTLFSFSPNGKRLVANSEVFGVKGSAEVEAGFCTYGAVLFDAADGRQLARQSAVDGCFTDFAWSPDSKEVAGIAANGWVFILDGNSGKLRLKFRAHQVFGGQVAWSPDGKTLVTASNPRLIQSPTGVGFESIGIFRMTVHPGKGEVSTTDGKIKHVLASRANGDCSLDGRSERLLKCFDARTGKPVGAPIPLQTGAVDVAFSPDGGQLAVGEHDFALVLDAQTLETERFMKVAKATSRGSVQAPVCVAWSVDGATLATSARGRLMLWRMR